MIRLRVLILSKHFAWLPELSPPDLPTAIVNLSKSNNAPGNERRGNTIFPPERADRKGTEIDVNGGRRRAAALLCKIGVSRFIRSLGELRVFANHHGIVTQPHRQPYSLNVMWAYER